MMKRGQFAFEFIVILTFSLLMTAVLINVFNNQLQDLDQQNERDTAQAINGMILNEITLAEQSPARYEREFFLPFTVNKKPYRINLSDGRDLKVTMASGEYIYFLPLNIGNESLLSRGENKIVKECDDSNNCKIYFSN